MPASRRLCENRVDRPRGEKCHPVQMLRRLSCLSSHGYSFNLNFFSSSERDCDFQRSTRLSRCMPCIFVSRIGLYLSALPHGDDPRQALLLMPISSRLQRRKSGTPEERAKRIGRESKTRSCHPNVISCTIEPPGSGGTV